MKLSYIMRIRILGFSNKKMKAVQAGAGGDASKSKQT